MKFRSKKFWFSAAAAVVVIVVVVLNFTGGNDDATQVQADLAYRDKITEIVTASGRVQPQTKVDITSEVSGQVVAVYVREGDRVERGQSLLQLDTVQLKADVTQARFSLEEITARTEAGRAQAQRDKLEYDRQKQLFDKQLTSELAYTDAQFAYENSQANYDAMIAQEKTGKARLEQEEDRLAKTRIVAPMQGVVTYLGVEVGEVAQAQTSFTQGKTLMTISDLSVFEVEVDVDETEIGKVRLGQTATINVDAHRDTSFAGAVAEIGNSATISGEGSENLTTSFRVKVRFADTDAVIKPGMSATVDIVTASAEDALLTPYAAVVTREFDPDSLAALAGRGDSSDEIVGSVQAAELDSPAVANANLGEHKEKVRKSGVFVIREGKARFVEVTTGIADERNIVALSGLQPGDTVVSGSFKTLRKLKDGDVVKIEESSLERMREN